MTDLPLSQSGSDHERAADVAARLEEAIQCGDIEAHTIYGRDLLQAIYGLLLSREGGSQ